MSLGLAAETGDALYLDKLRWKIRRIPYDDEAVQLGVYSIPFSEGMSVPIKDLAFCLSVFLPLPVLLERKSYTELRLNPEITE